MTRIACFGGKLFQQYRMSATLQANNDEPYTPGTMLRSDSGQIYKIENILVDLRKPLQCVYRARFTYLFRMRYPSAFFLLTIEPAESAEGKVYIVKNMVPGEFEYQLDLQKRLSSCPNVRAVIDTIKEFELFIFPFLAGDLLQLSLKPLCMEVRSKILRSALQGLADMHDRDFLHNSKFGHSRRLHTP